MPARIAAEAVRTGQTPPQSQADGRAVPSTRSRSPTGGRSGRRRRSRAGTSASSTWSAGESRNELLCQLTADATGLPVVAGPVEGAALGNVLVQARAAGVLSGGLADLRAAGARGLDLRRYEPGATGGPTDRQWAAAEHRVEGP